jgi:hypothetical protein
MPEDDERVSETIDRFATLTLGASTLRRELRVLNEREQQRERAGIPKEIVLFKEVTIIKRRYGSHRSPLQYERDIQCKRKYIDDRYIDDGN